MKGIKFALSQLDIKAGHPDENSKKIIVEIEKAKSIKVDVIVFSEMAVPGYLLGDEWENNSFISDLMNYNEDILAATKGITAIWGNVFVDFSKKGEDGRTRKYNAVYIASNGKWISNGVFEGHTFKSLLPKYREFDDERHFYSMIKLAGEQGKTLSDLLRPFPITVKGETVSIGVMLCEDMWSDDYALKPTDILVKNGAEIIVNLSCSPWTWRKNDKRNRVVKSLLEKNPIPFLYCNNVGTQNNGKNIFLFDGNSTVYNPDGSIMKVAGDYVEETIDVVVDRKNGVQEELRPLSQERDIAELYDGLVYGIKHFFSVLPNKKVVIGLSGGIDSAISAVLLVDALGPENVYAVNMPSRYNSDITKGAAAVLADNLKINYGIFPIQESVDSTIHDLKKLEFKRVNSAKTKLEVSGFVMENIQARDRGSRILAGISACLGGVFVNNGNKTETTLGYATLYGDVCGAIAPIADLYKGEIYDLARFVNTRAEKEIIPETIINVVPSAELSTEQDVTKGKGDPILYPYHDKLLKSFVEFRFDPEHILELYKAGNLESELKIETGLVNKYFPTAKEFIGDLEHKWRLYKNNIFKRIQSPPIIAVSRRAFGFDLRESQNGVYFTRRYKSLKEELQK